MRSLERLGNAEVDAPIVLADSTVEPDVDPFISEYARIEDGQAIFDRLYKGVEGNIRTVFVFD